MVPCYGRRPVDQLLLTGADAMDIVAEIAVWGVLGLVISLAFGLTLPAFIRTLRAGGADVFPDFLRPKPPKT